MAMFDTGSLTLTVKQILPKCENKNKNVIYVKKSHLQGKIKGSLFFTNLKMNTSFLL